MSGWTRRAAGIAAGVLAIAGAAQAAPCAGFTDVDDASAFCTSVAWMKNRAITLGCSATEYCPADFVRRDQMAAFMYRLGFQNAFLNGGNAFGAQAVVGTTDANRVAIIANGSVVARYEYGGVSPTIVSGYALNNVTSGAVGSTVAGGGAGGVQVVFPNRSLDCSQPFGEFCHNRVTDAYTTVSGGAGNRAGGGGFTDASDRPFASVGGGLGNVASGEASTVGGGMYNSASDFATTVAGGAQNRAGLSSSIAGGLDNIAVGAASSIGGGQGNTTTGSFSTIPGGKGNYAEGDFSFAAGLDNYAQGYGSFAVGVLANAVHDRAFVWNGNPNQDTSSLADGDFVVYAPSPGRVRLFAGAYGSGGCEIGSFEVGGNMTCQGTIRAMTFVPTSDRAMKSGVVPVDSKGVLARVLSMPIAEWSYTAAPDVRHMGPMGQDFHAAFGLGATDKGIATVDADGVALAAIQGLNAKLEARLAEKDAAIAARDAEIAQLKAGLVELRRAVELLTARVGGDERVATR